ncbi:MAG: hypothetical protein LUC43_04150 [Burkholderiales bacterium]|nr:hypothetical protein [Burkholderiales bacterium]
MIIISLLLVVIDSQYQVVKASDFDVRELVRDCLPLSSAMNTLLDIIET